ncbi:MAG: thymidine kinase [Bdellovibrionales bacterium]|nr:thymidine kinase [Bdellovibrionales bacterium]
MNYNQSGIVEVVCGSMFSGKTEELMRRLKRAQYAKQKIQVFKPVIDQRYSVDHVQSHDANRILSTPVTTAREILDKVDDNTRIIGIDEAQFFDDSIVEVAQKLAYSGKRVICAGLDMDFRGQPFGPMPKLLAIAESVTKLSAVCVVCGSPATRSQRMIATSDQNAGSSNEQVLVGAHDYYEARCRLCHEPNPITMIQPGLFPNANRSKILGKESTN